jgi:hypothetical protein
MFISGTKIETSIKMISQKQFESQFGTCFIITYINQEGQEFQYKGTSPVVFNDEDYHKIKATIKLNEWKGKTTVMLQRISLILTEEEKNESIRLKQEEIDAKNKQLWEETERRIREERERKEKRQIEKNKFMIDVQKYIGHECSFYGWSYDNSGQCKGNIKSIELSGLDDVKITFDNLNTIYSSMSSCTLPWSTLKCAIENGGKYESSRFSNWGTNITIKL